MKTLVRISLFFVLMLFSSCSFLKYGTKSEVTLEGESCNEPVTLTVLGKQGIQKYDNVTFPYTIKLKHKNLPLTICAETPNYIYKDIDVESRLADDTWYVAEKWLGGIAMGVGAGIGVIVAATCGIKDASFLVYPGFVAVGGMIYGHGCLNKVHIPEFNNYSFSLLGQKKNNPEYCSAADMTYEKFISIYNKSGKISNESYNYILCKSYKKARKSLDNDIKNDDNATARYFRGICNMNLKHYFDASHDFNKAELLYGYNDSFKQAIDSLYYAAHKAFLQKSEQNAAMWEGIGEFSKLLGTATQTTINSIHSTSGTPLGNANTSSTTSDSSDDNDASNSSSKTKRKCSYCTNGRVVVTMNPNTYGQQQNQYNVKCEECGGTFRVNTHSHKNCSHCGGTGYAK